MILIIDGYNLLKQIFPGVKRTLDKQRSAFIQQLAYYKSKKEPQIKEIIVVFDAGPSTHATRTVKSGIIVVFSGIKSTADSWILEFIERNKEKELLIITLDRALRNACQKHNADTLDVYEFYKALQHNLLTHAEQTFASQDQMFEKYEDIDDEELKNTRIDSRALDLMMEQASIQTPEKLNNDASEDKMPRKGRSQSLSKKDRRMLQKLKKLQWKKYLP